MPILVGLDVGTSGLKAIAVRSESGAVIASASREYPLYAEQPQWAELDARLIEHHRRRWGLIAPRQVSAAVALAN